MRHIRPVALVVVMLLVLFIAVCAVARCTGAAGEGAHDAGAGHIEQMQAGEQEARALGKQTDTGGEPLDAGGAPSEDAGVLGTEILGPPAVCPVAFTDAYEESTYHNAWGDGWTFASARDTDENAAQVLETLQADGWDLLFASGLDLSGQAWGCVAFHEQKQETVLAYMVPKIIGRAHAADNPLVISIVRIDHAS